MDKCCYICGVVGFFPEKIATCIKCRSIFIHVYCMKIAQLIVPNDWVCEDCSDSSKHASGKFTDDVHVLRRSLKVIPAGEAIALASQSSLSKGKKPLASPEKAFKPLEIPKKQVEKDTSTFPFANLAARCDLRVCKQEKLPACVEQNRYKMQSTHIPSEVAEPSLKLKSCLKNSVHARTLSPPSRFSPKFNELFPSHTPSKKLRWDTAQGGFPCNDTLKASKNPKKQRLPDEQLVVDRYLPNHLASHATWKGSFRTSDFASPVTSCDIVWGYPPEKVARKAYEFSKKMPDVLHLEVIPRCRVWEHMFNEGGPDKNDIGLYFLPVGNKSEQRYSCLVSHLEKQDIILKSCIRGIELLIFTSSHLDDKSKKINKAYYLWGLFVPPVITSKKPQQNQQ